MAFNQTRSSALTTIRVGASKLALDRISIKSCSREVAGEGAFLVTDKTLQGTKESDPLLAKSSKILSPSLVSELARDLVSNVFVNEKKPYLIPKEITNLLVLVHSTSP